ncbi:MAG: hypothetical protein HXX14_10280 [Bacteroidetes bacterium]|nr:hypothetical protein [Bacteroidota bacterium]
MVGKMMVCFTETDGIVKALSILSRKFVHSFSILYRYGLSMEELWTKYGDTMDKTICLGTALGYFPINLWRALYGILALIVEQFKDAGY